MTVCEEAINVLVLSRGRKTRDQAFFPKTYCEYGLNLHTGDRPNGDYIRDVTHVTRVSGLSAS